VGGGDSLRLFCALRLPDDVVEALVRWQRRELRGRRAPPAGERIVPPANLHVTLAFLGSRPAAELPAIVAALRTAAGDAGRIRLAVRDYRETRSVGMLTFDDEEGRATALAERLHSGLEELRVYEREQRRWLPHVTVLRFREAPGLRPRLPELGEVAPSDAAVYISRLRPGGAEYEVLETAQFGR
jgi:2'-5' RNA ligase